MDAAQPDCPPGIFRLSSGQQGFCLDPTPLCALVGASVMGFREELACCTSGHVRLIMRKSLCKETCNQRHSGPGVLPQMPSQGLGTISIVQGIEVLSRA